MLNKIYIVLASVALGYYAADGMFGWEYGNPQRTIGAGRRPPVARLVACAGTSHFWYSGYRGGK